MKVLNGIQLTFEKELALFNLDRIIYHHIASQENFSIVALVIPAKMEFSLHNHPDMLVVSKLLSGRLLIESMNISLVK